MREGGKGKIDPQLRFLFSSVAAEKALLHIYQHGRGNVTAIIRDHGLGGGETQRALDRLVQGNFLVKRREGRAVFYHFNDHNSLVPPLLDLVRAAYQNISEEERKATFSPKYSP